MEFNLANLSPCDVLALSAALSAQIAQPYLDDCDTLAFLGDLFTAIGGDLSMMATQCALIQKKQTQQPATQTTQTTQDQTQPDKPNNDNQI